MSVVSEAIADAEQRRLALDVTRSFVVQAPAGSGKTGLLVQRFLALLARVERPEAVLAITFTRKAAGEMRKRILEALRDASTRKSPPEEDFQRTRWELARAVLERDAAAGWGLLHSPSRLQVFTIDGYCSRIVAGTPLLSRLGSTPTVVEHSVALYREAARRTLSAAGRELLGEPAATLLERYEMGLGTLEDELVAMLGRRDQWLEGVLASQRDEAEWTKRLEAAFGRALTIEVAEIAAGLENDLAERIHDIARRSRAAGGGEEWPTLGEKHFLGDDVASAPAWKQAAMMLAKKGELRGQRSHSEDVFGDDADLRSDYLALLKDICDLAPERLEAWQRALKVSTKLAASPSYRPAGREALGALLTLLRHAAGALWQVFRERREVDFGQVALAAVDALEPGETLEKIDARIEHVLVDEFQDTSVSQRLLLEGITSGWQADGSRTLFLVGDPMQSIYRFRKAEVGLFLAARSTPDFLPGCHLHPLGLSVNFRSTRNVIGWVNATFSKLLGTRDDAVRSLVAFAEASAGPHAAEGIEIEFLKWESPVPVDKSAADAVEAAGLADLIVEDVEARRSGSLPKSDGTPIAVLVRSRAHALPLLRALESRAPAVRVRAPGLDMLGDRSVVQDLEALTRAIVHPGDRLSWLAMMRSPWVGLPLAEIALLVEPDVAAHGRKAPPVPLVLRDAQALSRVSDDSRVRLAKLLEVIDAARAELATRSIDLVVRSAWLRLGGSTASRTGMQVESLDADSFFDLLAARSRDGTVDLDDFSLALAGTEAAVDADSDADVEVMTMHKAKGLEFDTVILPALARATRGNRKTAVALETDPATGLLLMMAPRKARGRRDDDGDKFGFLEMREKRREESEALRLLYVAATRAKRRLVLSFPAGRLKAKGEVPSGCLLAAMAPALDIAEARSVLVAAEGYVDQQPMKRFPAGFVLEAVPDSIRDRSLETVSPSDLAETRPRFFADSRISAHIGTVYHAFVQRIAAEGVSQWDVARVAKEKSSIEHALRSAGALSSEMAAATERVSRALEVTLADEKGRWILGAGEQARSEWSIVRLRDGRLTSAAVDRTFVDDGVRWIVDFKTGALAEADEGAADGDPVARRRAQYAPQLATYRDLLRAHAGAGDTVPIRLALYFPEWPEGRRWQPIDDETLPAV
jgi:ATP-dependent helicase/nuclease subunit A